MRCGRSAADCGRPGFGPNCRAYRAGCSDGSTLRSVNLLRTVRHERSLRSFLARSPYPFFRPPTVHRAGFLEWSWPARMTPRLYEVVTLAVASMPTYEASEALYYQSGFLAKAGLGLVYLPPPGRAAPTAAGLVTLRQPVDRFLTLPAEAPPARHFAALTPTSACSVRP